MRQIEFRGKRKDNSRWTYGYVDAMLYRDIVVIHTDGSTHEVDTDTVEQYTGCIDDYGKDIYEGDIIRYGATLKSKLVVRYRDGSFIAQDDGTSDCIYLSEIFRIKRFSPPKTERDRRFNIVKVVGNIHDNPELLKGDNNAKTNN